MLLAHSLRPRNRRSLLNPPANPGKCLFDGPILEGRGLRVRGEGPCSGENAHPLAAGPCRAFSGKVPKVLVLDGQSEIRYKAIGRDSGAFHMGPGHMEGAT